MKNEQYIKLRDQVSEMNKINDEISLINWNREDGPKFSSVEDMKDFEKKLKNNEFDYFFDKENNNSILDTRDVIIESFSHTLEDISFYIYTLRDHSYYPYLSSPCHSHPFPSLPTNFSILIVYIHFVL